MVEDASGQAFVAIVLYRYLVNDQATGTVDIQVRYYLGSDEEAVRERIQRERMTYHQNASGESAKWVLGEIIAVEALGELEDGQEIAGFVRSFGTGRRLSDN